MIEVHRVSKVYSVGPVKVPALREVSFRIAKGEFVVLTGASGAGKTTLLRLLYRDDLPSEGDIEVLGYDLVPMRRSHVAALRRSIGVVFQDAKLLPVRTVYENVAFVLRVLGTPRREITERVFDALRTVGMSSRAQAYPAQLSQGSAASRAGAGHREAPAAAPRRRADRQPRRVDGRRDRRGAQRTSGRVARRSCWPPTRPGWPRRSSAAP